MSTPAPRPLRIAIVANSFPERSETFISRPIEALVARGHDVTVFTMRPGDPTVFSALTADELRRMTVQCTRIPRRSWRRQPGRALSLTGALGLRPAADVWRDGVALTLADAIRRHAPFDIVHAHYAFHATLAAAIARSGLARAAFVSVHGVDLRVDDGHAQHLWRRSGHLATVFGQSAWALDQVRRHGVDDSRLHLLRNGVDTSFFAPSSRARPAGPRTLVTVARLHPVKQLEVAIEAVAIAHRRRPDAVGGYTILGEGSERDALEDLCRRLGVADVVELGGAADPPAVRDALRAADIFLLSSAAEGMPNAVLEGHAVGLPAVVTDVGGLSELVDHDTGRLVPPGDPAAMAEAILELATHADLESMGRRARGRVIESFSLERNVDEREAAYRRALASS